MKEARHDVNVHSLTGVVLPDPRQRTLASGTSALFFRVSCSESRRRAGGDEPCEEVSVFDCVAFGEKAKDLARQITPGCRIAVSGRGRTYLKGARPQKSVASDPEKGAMKYPHYEVIVRDATVLDALGASPSCADEEISYASLIGDVQI